MPTKKYANCLSNEQFAQYIANTRSGVILGDLDDHIQGCDICRGRLFFLEKIKGKSAEEILANWPKTRPEDRKRAMEFLKNVLTKPKRRREDDED